MGQRKASAALPLFCRAGEKMGRLCHQNKNSLAFNVVASPWPGKKRKRQRVGQADTSVCVLGTQVTRLCQVWPGAPICFTVEKEGQLPFAAQKSERAQMENGEILFWNGAICEKEAKKGRIVENLLFVCYPKCSTCQKAEKWLQAHKCSYTIRDIKLDRPKEAEIGLWHKKSGLPLKRFFNTSGQLYRQKNLAEALKDMPAEKQMALLAEDGMLVKRPILVGQNFVLLGFKPVEWEAVLLANK